MSNPAYHRFISDLMGTVCVIGMTVGTGMFATGMADHFLHLDWGWDYHSLWIALIAVAIAYIIFRVSRLTKKLLGGDTA